MPREGCAEGTVGCGDDGADGCGEAEAEDRWKSGRCGTKVWRKVKENDVFRMYWLAEETEMKKRGQRRQDKAESRHVQV